MPNLYSTIPSPTILARQGYDPLADPSPTPSIFESTVPVVVVDNTPLPPIAMLAVKIYAFGGLAFMWGVILTGISYWIWVVVVKGEFADSPPELDIHPERMREKEKARIARLKVQKEIKDEKRRRREEEKWRVPPLQYKKKDQSHSATSSKPALKPAIRRSGMTSKSLRSKSARPATGSVRTKHVSWASSASTLDKDGNLGVVPLEDKERDRSRLRTRPPRSPLREVPPAHLRSHRKRRMN